MRESKDKIYDVDHLAEFFGVSKKTVWLWCQKGKLPAFKIGKEWKVRVSDLNRMIAGKISAKTEKGKTLF